MAERSSTEEGVSRREFMVAAGAAAVIGGASVSRGAAPCATAATCNEVLDRDPLERVSHYEGDAESATSTEALRSSISRPLSPRADYPPASHAAPDAALASWRLSERRRWGRV